MDYVLGFQFDIEGAWVALIEKKRPTWQAGLWNGIGGHIEPHESPEAAMGREFAEETGVSQGHMIWRHYATLETWTGNHVFCYSSFTDEVRDVATVTDERVIVFQTSSLATNRHCLVPSVLWMVEMALSMGDLRAGGDGRESPDFLTVREMPPVRSP